jgi:class II flagellar assembly regulator FliX
LPAGRLCLAGQILPVIYGRLTIIPQARTARVSPGEGSHMRIQGPVGTAASASTAVARRSGARTFSLSGEAESRPAGAPAALRTVGGIDALIALQGVQGVEGATERRKHAVKRGRLALDALDELKIGLLGGSLAPATLTRLKSAAAFLRDGSGDAGLDGVLGEIELRVEVEIAKIAAR